MKLESKHISLFLTREDAKISISLHLFGLLFTISAERRLPSLSDVERAFNFDKVITAPKFQRPDQIELIGEGDATPEPPVPDPTPTIEPQTTTTTTIEIPAETAPEEPQVSEVVPEPQVTELAVVPEVVPEVIVVPEPVKLDEAFVVLQKAQPIPFKATKKYKDKG